jgi:hypothetical protein
MVYGRCARNGGRICTWNKPFAGDRAPGVCYNHRSGFPGRRGRGESYWAAGFFREGPPGGLGGLTYGAQMEDSAKSEPLGAREQAARGFRRLRLKESWFWRVLSFE